MEVASQQHHLQAGKLKQEQQNLFISLQLTNLFVQLVTKPDLVGAGNCWRAAVAVLEYGPGVGGWRKELVSVWNGLAALWVAVVASTLGSTFYGWLLGRARDVDPLLLV